MSEERTLAERPAVPLGGKPLGGMHQNPLHLGHSDRLPAPRKEGLQRHAATPMRRIQRAA
eukprot:8170298-Alexandrium_andersonii.AAC.1